MLLLIFALVIEVGGLVLLYNRLVNTQHAVVEAREELKALETGNAELKSTAFGMLNAANLEGFVRERGLVQDKKPQYVSAHQPWLASQ
ncbi:hypothetical protein C4571_03540 [Candidatus Parcubacteria bacterium]|nr:MAG: hypothetical protein C4571_03540 [Candidatus Parcubacteria bacterium]